MNEQSPEIKLTPQDVLAREMEKIWTTLGHSQKEALLTQATRASFLNQAIAHLPAMQMEALSLRNLSANGAIKLSTV